MEPPETPSEHLHEQIHEAAHEIRERWSMYAAVSTALMAVLAALGSLFAGHHSNEALIEQIRASDQWAFYQAKGIKYELTIGLNRPVENASADIKAKAERYKNEQEEIKEKAEDYQKASEVHLEKHVLLARSVTFYQIAIAISAIAMLTKRRFMWYFALLISVGGTVYFCLGIL